MEEEKPEDDFEKSLAEQLKTGETKLILPSMKQREEMREEAYRQREYERHERERQEREQERNKVILKINRIRRANIIRERQGKELIPEPQLEGYNMPFEIINPMETVENTFDIETQTLLKMNRIPVNIEDDYVIFTVDDEKVEISNILEDFSKQEEVITGIMEDTIAENTEILPEETVEEHVVMEEVQPRIFGYSEDLKGLYYEFPVTQIKELGRFKEEREIFFDKNEIRDLDAYIIIKNEKQRKPIIDVLHFGYSQRLRSKRIRKIKQNEEKKPKLEMESDSLSNVWELDKDYSIYHNYNRLTSYAYEIEAEMRKQEGNDLLRLQDLNSNIHIVLVQKKTPKVIELKMTDKERILKKELDIQSLKEINSNIKIKEGQIKRRMKKYENLIPTLKESLEGEFPSTYEELEKGINEAGIPDKTLVLQLLNEGKSWYEAIKEDEGIKEEKRKLKGLIRQKENEIENLKQFVKDPNTKKDKFEILDFESSVEFLYKETTGKIHIIINPMIEEEMREISEIMKMPITKIIFRRHPASIEDIQIIKDIEEQNLKKYQKRKEKKEE